MSGGFRKHCRNDNDCARGFSCRTIKCRGFWPFNANGVPDYIDGLMRRCSLIDHGRNSRIIAPDYIGGGGGRDWVGTGQGAGTGGMGTFIDWFVDNCN